MVFKSGPPARSLMAVSDRQRSRYGRRCSLYKDHSNAPPRARQKQVAVLDHGPHPRANCADCMTSSKLCKLFFRSIFERTWNSTEHEPCSSHLRSSPRTADPPEPSPVRGRQTCPEPRSGRGGAGLHREMGHGSEMRLSCAGAVGDVPQRRDPREPSQSWEKRQWTGITAKPAPIADG